MASQLDQGREAFDRREWEHAYSQLSTAAEQQSLDPEDLERLADAAYLTGRDTDRDEVLARAHHAWLAADNPQRAAGAAFWLGFGLVVRGEEARGSGWLARAHRIVEDGDLDCVERGYLFVSRALAQLDRRDPDGAYEAFGTAAEIGERFGDPDLITLGRLGCGQALIRSGRIAEGVALLDEAMVAATAGEDEVSARVIGIVYCAVLLECQAIFDLRRARQWTAAFANWCAAQPDLVPYRGQCLVHRAEVMQLHGDWPDALDQAQRACQALQNHPAIAVAYNQLGELHRLRGEFAAAETAYREASRRGWIPQPGLALLRLAQGDVAAAAAAMRTVMDEADDHLTRAGLLSAYVEIVITVGDVPVARTAADELSQIADSLGTPFTQAMAAHATGAVLRAEGDGRAALTALRQAWSAWQKLDTPYEAARARVLIGLACQDLGDHDGAALEFDAARWVFQQLGAVPDIHRAEKLALSGRQRTADRLTAREVEVLRLVAAGKTNRAIAGDLFLSEKTVARHVSNILTKLDLPSRSAATAYAYENDLV